MRIPISQKRKQAHGGGNRKVRNGTWEFPYPVSCPFLGYRGYRVKSAAPFCFGFLAQACPAICQTYGPWGLV